MKKKILKSAVFELLPCFISLLIEEIENNSEIRTPEGYFQLALNRLTSYWSQERNKREK